MVLCAIIRAFLRCYNDDLTTTRVNEVINLVCEWVHVINYTWGPTGSLWHPASLTFILASVVVGVMVLFTSRSGIMREVDVPGSAPNGRGTDGYGVTDPLHRRSGYTGHVTHQDDVGTLDGRDVIAAQFVHDTCGNCEVRVRVSWVRFSWVRFSWRRFS